MLAGRGLGSASMQVTYVASLPQAPWEWPSILALTAGVIMGAAVTCAVYFLNQPDSEGDPPSLSLHVKAGQLTITWSPAVTAQGATLEIVDGRRRTTVPVAEPLAGVTYAADGADVQIRLTPSGAGEVETARYLVQELPFARLQAQFDGTLAEAYALHTAMRRQDNRISDLEASARALTLRTRIHSHSRPRSHPRPRPRPQPRQTPVVTRWWR